MNRIDSTNKSVLPAMVRRSRAHLSPFSEQNNIEGEIIDIDIEGDSTTSTCTTTTTIEAPHVEVIVIDETGDDSHTFQRSSVSTDTASCSSSRNPLNQQHSVISIEDDDEDDDYDEYDYVDMNKGNNHDDLVVLWSNSDTSTIPTSKNHHSRLSNPEPGSTFSSYDFKQYAVEGYVADTRFHDNHSAAGKRRRNEGVFFQIEDPLNPQPSPDSAHLPRKSPRNRTSVGATGRCDGASSSTAVSDRPPGKCRRRTRGSGAGGVDQAGEDPRVRKYFSFGQFGIVNDHTDHFYSHNGSSGQQPSKSWVKKVQKEWKILESSLPESIFVRVYETRLDILRAAIIGAKDTPYHNGIFFFDICFPYNYPNVPPLVHYRSWGMRVNPNLYECGKVCLSLLNTWMGEKCEKWVGGMSNMLQVLVSIQGLVLNSQPYFNEPGFAPARGTDYGNHSSRAYNRQVYLFSLRSMLNTLNNPPKNFEGLVKGHFGERKDEIVEGWKEEKEMQWKDGRVVGVYMNEENMQWCQTKLKEAFALLDTTTITSSY